MANHKSAAKRHRQSEKRRVRNKHIRSTVRNAIRDARAAASQGSAEAPAAIKRAEQLLRRAQSKGAYHARTVSRTVSRLAKLAR